MYLLSTTVSPANDWLTCFSFLLLFPVLFTLSLIVWFAVLSWAELQSGSDDIITHIMHHPLPALRERGNLRYTLTHNKHTHMNVSPAGHLRIRAANFLSPWWNGLQVKVGVSQLARYHFWHCVMSSNWGWTQLAPRHIHTGRTWLLCVLIRDAPVCALVDYT